MFNDIIIGQYIAGSSPLHRLDARVKILLTVAYLAVVFMADTAVSYAIASAFTVMLVIISDIPVKAILKGLRPVLWILLFMAVINLFTVKGETLVSLPFYLTITREGAKTAAATSIRLVLLVVGASLLMLTTSPISLTDGIERLLRPLEKIKVPAHDIAMMMSIAIRFIPVFSEEADRIKKAQTARGADFKSGNIINRAKAMLPIFVPLFISAFRRANNLAEAMDARCYRSKGRTSVREVRLTAYDAAAIAVFIAFAAILTAAEFVIEF